MNIKIKSLKRIQTGFTLIELLVVIGILAILLAITLIAINPNKHFQDTRNAQRSSNVSAILDAVYEYESANNGNVPPALSGLAASQELCLAASPTAGCPSGSIDLCSNLTPTYLADLPMDPGQTAADVTGGTTPCATGVTDYDTGYTIAPAAGGRFTVSAPNAEGSATISVTR